MTSVGAVTVGVMLVVWGVASVGVALWLRRRFQSDQAMEPISGGVRLPDDFEP